MLPKAGATGNETQLQLRIVLSVANTLLTTVFCSTAHVSPHTVQELLHAADPKYCWIDQ